MGVENNIPNEWSESTLGDLITHKKGFAFKSKDYSKNGRKIVKAKDFTSNSIDDTECDFISEELAESFSDYELKHKDVIIQTVGSWPSNPASIVGKVVRVPQKVEGALLNQNAVKLNSTKNVDNDFLFYSLIYKRFKSHLISRAQGSANQASITLKDIFDYELNLPPLPEQKAIAKVLTAFDDKIELLQAQNKTLETMAQTIFNEWFGKYQIGDELPDGWRVEKLGDILETYLGGTPSKSKNEYWDNGSIPWINSGEVNNFRITRGTTLITKLGLEKSATKLLPKGTVVIAITGATLGQYSILEIESCFNQSVVGIVGNNKIKSSFIYFWIAKNIHAIIRNATGGAQQHINKENVNSFEMIIPSDELLNKFQSIVEPMMDKISNNEFEIQSLTKTRDTLLPKLMSGQVRINNIKQTIDA